MFTLRIIGKFSSKKILLAEFDTKNNRPDGLIDLFMNLANTGHCESYMATRIYYLAYLLSDKYPGLKFKIEEKAL